MGVIQQMESQVNVVYTHPGHFNSIASEAQQNDVLMLDEKDHLILSLMLIEQA